MDLINGETRYAQQQRERQEAESDTTIQSSPKKIGDDVCVLFTTR